MRKNIAILKTRTCVQAMGRIKKCTPKHINHENNRSVGQKSTVRGQKDGPLHGAHTNRSSPVLDVPPLLGFLPVMLSTPPHQEMSLILHEAMLIIGISCVLPVEHSKAMLSQFTHPPLPHTSTSSGCCGETYDSKPLTGACPVRSCQDKRKKEFLDP